MYDLSENVCKLNCKKWNDKLLADLSDKNKEY